MAFFNSSDENSLPSRNFSRSASSVSETSSISFSAHTLRPHLKIGWNLASAELAATPVVKIGLH